MFSWIQFNNSMLKCDFGFTIIFLLATLLVDDTDYLLDILDCTLVITLFVNIFVMRNAVNNVLI